MGKLCMFKLSLVLANDDDDGSNDAFDLVEERSSLVERAVTNLPGIH